MNRYFFILLLLPISLLAQKNVGIGISEPSSRLHIHQEDASAPISEIRFDNFNTGLTTADGLAVGINGFNSYMISQESGNLSLGTNKFSILNLLSNGKLGMNTATLIGSSDFTLRSTNVIGFGGMYIDSPDEATGKPFYGYGLDGSIGAYHFLDASDSRMKFSFATVVIPTFSFSDQGRFFLNTNESIASENFTLKNTVAGFGGMLIESPDASTGKPMYAYAVDGEFRARHYYDEGDDRFHIDFDTEGLGSFEMTKAGKFFLNGATAVGQEDFTLTSTNSSSFGGMSINSPNGLNGRPFYGYATGGILRAFHYFDQPTSSWILQVASGETVTIDDDGDMGIGNSSPDEKLVVDGRMRLTQGSTTSASNGTIVFNGTNFYGRINGFWYKMTDATVNQPPAGDDEVFKQSINSSEDEVFALKEENEQLKARLLKLDERLKKLESHLELK